MTYLVVGLDRRTLAPWHSNVLDRDATHATQAALARAGAEGVDLIVAAVIGANSSVLSRHPGRSARKLKAA